jgi:hypothetical protein
MNVFLRRLGWTLLIGLLVVVPGRGQARAGVLFEQPPLPTDYFMFGLNSNLNGQVIFDNFVLPSDSVVTNLGWSGAYQMNTVPTNPVPFSVSFYSDQGGLPGTLLSTQNVSVLGTQTGVSPTSGYLIRTYDALLPTTVNLTGGARTWVSIVETETSMHDTWMWQFSKDRGGNGVAYQNGPNATLAWRDNFDVSFSLAGTAAVPEPSTLALTSLGVVVVVGVQLARRARAAK